LFLLGRFAHFIRLFHELLYFLIMIETSRMIGIQFEAFTSLTEKSMGLLGQCRTRTLDFHDYRPYHS
jgi:hypothetical protein